MTCGAAHCAIFIKKQTCSICPANSYHLVQHDIENNLQLSRRAGDDLEHLRTCRLLLQRFRQLVAALLRLEQPHVLDGNHHLVGKGRHQLDFAVGERFYSVASERNDANRLTLGAAAAVVAKSVDDLHSDLNNINKQTALTENGEIVSGRGDAINMHEHLTGSDPQGLYSTAGGDTTCGNWGYEAAMDLPSWSP